ncbi:MAG: 16S rRNA (cytosine(1402)-N(4))-methyltransferase RsmH [Ginsengibacter sp.]
MQKGIYHVPVMLHEVIDGLQVKPDGIYVDCTFGGGGHSKAILSKLNQNGRLLAFDQDEDAKPNVPKDDRLTFIPHNFRYLQRFLRLHKIAKVNGVLADLGVSSYQVNEPTRGFSFRFDAPLDMRMDQRQNLTASEIITKYPEEKLHKVFEMYGEVTNAKTLAKTIVNVRHSMPLHTINEFKNAIQPVIKGSPHKYFAQVFQAIRIELNDEFGALKEMLAQLPGVLEPGGRVAIVTFHSLEDRIVKNFFKNGSSEQNEPDEVYGTKLKNTLTVITKKPILPGVNEIKDNPRARSAKLRIAERSYD